MCFTHPANPTNKERRTMSRPKKIRLKSDLPEHVIEDIARCILPDIIAYYESEEGQKEFEKWKAEQKANSNDKDTA